MKKLLGKVALITGAARGQGRETALELAAQGCHIAALDIACQLPYPAYKLADGEELTQLVAEIPQIYPQSQSLALFADVRDVQQVEAAVAKTLAEFSRIDILFNNAGICFYGSAHELTEEAWDSMIDINLKGSWLMAKYVIPTMMEQKSGVIINNSSIAGLRGMNRLSHYAASKWGLTGLSKSLAIELAPFNIRVISIHPTGVNTPMNDGLAQMEGLTPQQVAEKSAGNLLPVPWIEPQDVAKMVAFLVSDDARYITGSEVVIDAGLLTR